MHQPPLTMVLCAVALLAARRADGVFTAKPTVGRDGAATVVRFAVSRPCDVEVAVLDASGRVVRHLAAGVLGGAHAPPAPLQPGLSQSLTWDGRDDSGAPTPEHRTPSTFSFRVRAGMGVKLEQIVGGDPYAFWTEASGQGDHAQWRVTGLEAKPDGSVYVLGSITPYGLPALRQYDARGSYRRTVFPPPAGKPLADVQGWGVNTLSNGTYALRATYGWCSGVPSWTVMCGGRDSGGIWGARLVPSSPRDTLCLAGHPGVDNLQMTIATDSTLREFAPVPALGGEPPPKGGLAGSCLSALAPDGASLFVSGIFACDSRGRALTNGFWRNGQVWKVDLASHQPTVFFALSPEEMMDPAPIGHAAATPYAALQGVAADAAGHVFVCDRQNRRVAVLDAGGHLVRSLPVTNADAVAVHPTSKALYVTTRFGNYGGNGELKLMKFSDWTKDDAPDTTLLLRTGIGKFRESSLLALAEDKGETLVWVAYTTLPARVYRDTGEQLELIKDFYEAGPQRALDLQHMVVDAQTGDAYVPNSQGFLFRVRDWTKPQFEPCLLDAKTRLGASTVAIDARSRHLYTQGHYRDPVRRWSLDGAFLTPAPAGDSHDVVPPVTCAWVFTGLWRRGMAAAPGGGLATLGVVPALEGRWDNYSGPLHYFKPEPAKTPWPGLRFSGFGGKNPNTGGLRFDLRGNLYVGLADGKPSNVPSGFEQDKDFKALAGRIHKFAPTGPAAAGDLFPTEPAAPARIYDVHCGSLSQSAHFGVDGYGRIYYPTGLLPQVSVIDNEGAPILRFGTYGNRDSLGGLPGDLVPTPDVPMAWPNSVDATDNHIYVSDVLNVRLMRLAKTFAACETARIP